MSYRATIRLEENFQNKGERWVARDESGTWRSYCAKHFADSAVVAATMMYHTCEVLNVSGGPVEAVVEIADGHENRSM
jgi:hypothetical protein